MRKIKGGDTELSKLFNGKPSADLGSYERVELRPRTDRLTHSREASTQTDERVPARPEIGHVKLLKKQQNQASSQKSQYMSSPPTSNYNERKTKYDEVRKIIFCTGLRPVQEGVVTNKIRKARARYSSRKSARRQVVESVVSTARADPRVYLEVEVEGKKVQELLDSGASVSLVENKGREIIEGVGVDIKPFWATCKSAGGSDHHIVAKVVLPVLYKGTRRQILFYICPSLQQSVYFDIDFWKEFDLAPEVVGVAEIQESYSQESADFGLDSNMHQLSKEQRRQLEESVKKFRTYEQNGLAKTHLLTHKIDLTPGTTPIKDRHYPVSPAVQQLIYEEIDNMLSLGIIEESNSSWNNRITLVRRPGKNRLCLDARKLNAVTVKDAYPLPQIEGILGRLDETYYISSIDLKHAFWQIELDKESRGCTAFTVPGRPLYQFRMMPFGLCNAAQRLCRLMDKVIPQKLKGKVFVYLDDLLLISRDFDTHLKLIDEVAKCLQAANLTIGAEKSKFCFRELRYLGFIVGGGTLKTDPEKVAAVSQTSVPRTVREVRSFLGNGGMV